MDEASDTPAPTARPTGCQFTVQTGDEGDVVVIVIGDLDPASARVLVELVESGIGSPGTSRGLQVDLRRVRACSNSGMRALTACVEMGAGLREGVHFRVGIVPDASD